MSFRPVAIVGAGALTAFGRGWRGLAGSCPAGVAAAVVDDVDARVRKTMSPAARLAALAARDAVREAGWSAPLDDVGFFLGVGASGASMDELTALLRASVAGGALSMAALGERGLRACNPLFTFQLMNNFTLCHAAILEGTGGPNAALFSNGAATADAIAEAAWAIHEGACERALTGGADTALHPITAAELAREGAVRAPSEAAAVLALARDAESPLAWLTTARSFRGPDALREALRGATASEAGAVVLAPDAALADEARALAPRLPLEGPACGDALAATPAVALLSALDRLHASAHTRIAVVTRDRRGDAALLTLRSHR